MIWIYLIIVNTLLYFFSLGLIASFKEDIKWTIRYAWIPPYQLLVLSLVIVLISIMILFGIYNFFKHILKCIV
jgi:hypothetical protein